MLQASRRPEDPRIELFLPFLTQGTCYKLLTLPTYLLISLLSIYLSAPRIQPLHHLNTQTLKRGKSTCVSLHSAMCEAEKEEARGLLIEALHVAPVLLLSLHITALTPST